MQNLQNNKDFKWIVLYHNVLNNNNIFLMLKVPMNWQNSIITNLLIKAATQYRKISRISINLSYLRIATQN